MFACPACGQSNPTDSRFCGECGKSLEGAKPLGLVGSTIANRYHVLRVIAEGGMGIVYEAEQQMGEGSRKVAIKTLLPELSHDHVVVSRFTRECAVVASLEHPNTVRVYDFGRTDEGILYIAMEYVRGRPLGDVIAEGKMPLERCLNIVEQMTLALEEAHGLGIVHRDLKPDNVILSSRAGISDFVKLLDFGIAKRSSEGGKHDTKLTQQGMVLGTPPYMSPEQFTSEPLDRLTDIYALSVIVYEMLNGRLPFDADTPWQWAHHHLSSEPLPFIADVPKSVEQVVLAGLSKIRGARPPSAREFYRMLAQAAGVRSERNGSVVAAATARTLPPVEPRNSPVPEGRQIQRTEPSRVIEPPLGNTPFDTTVPRVGNTDPGNVARSVTEPSMAPLAVMVGATTEPSVAAISRSGYAPSVGSVAGLAPPHTVHSRQKRRSRVGAYVGIFGLLALAATAAAAILYWREADVPIPPLPVPMPTDASNDAQPAVVISSESNVRMPAPPPARESRGGQVPSPRARVAVGAPAEGQAGGAPARPTTTTASAATASPPNTAAPQNPFPIQLPFPIPTQLLPPGLPVPQQQAPTNTATPPPNSPTQAPANVPSAQGTAACTESTMLASSNMHAAVEKFLICRSSGDSAVVQSTRIALANIGRNQAAALARRGQCNEAREIVTELARIGAQRPAQAALSSTACGG